MVAYLFPGQGDQHAGMLDGLPDDPASTAVLDTATAILAERCDRDLADLDRHAADGDQVAAQLSVVICGIAAGRALVERAGPPDVAAGHSVGAFAAAVIASALDMPAALVAVHLRASLMAQLFDDGWGMLAIDGLGAAAARRLIRSVSSAHAPHLYLANVNASDQVVLAGAQDCLAAAEQAAADQGARRATRLPVSVPSHCSPLAPVTDALRRELAGAADAPLAVDIIANTTGRTLRTTRAVLDDLAASVSQTVRWGDGIAAAVERGVDTMVQMPPGRTLVGLVHREHPDVQAYSLADTSLHDAALCVRQARDRETP
jgi:malonate decarboxylase epsilon subunit